jgi:DNA-directed RNA polymerase subunit RPC12/RpoP
VILQQLDLFSDLSVPEPEMPAPKPKRKRQPKMTTYACGRCGRTIQLAYSPVSVVCGCGGKMRPKEE